MQQASTGFTDALRYGSYLVVARLTVYAGGAPTTYVVPVSDCQITVDRNSAQRRSGSITVEVLPTVPPNPLLPINPTSFLAPFGNEVFVETTVATGSTLHDWVPLGLFALATSTVNDSAIDLTTTLSVYDRSWVISQRALTAPYNLPAAGGNFVAEIQALLNHVWGSGLTYNMAPTSYTVPPASLPEQQDPWAAAQQMAAEAGQELYFDVNGVVVSRPIPDPTTAPVVWNFVEELGVVGGNPAGGGRQFFSSPYTTPAGVTLTMTRDRVNNDFIVSGTGTQNAPGSASGSTAPVRGEAKDTNPSSPTYVSGKFGDQPSFSTSPLITTSSAANAMASNLLAASLAEAWKIQVVCPPNALFDVDDVVAVTRERLGLAGQRFVVDTITHVVRYDAVTTLAGRVLP